MPKPKSKKQARFFGAIAGGRGTNLDMSPATARALLRGTTKKGLPSSRRKTTAPKRTIPK